jgi:hypothetical protein
MVGPRLHREAAERGGEGLKIGGETDSVPDPAAGEHYLTAAGNSLTGVSDRRPPSRRRAAARPGAAVRPFGQPQ